MTEDEVRTDILAEFRRERRLGSALTPDALELSDDGVLTLAGEVGSVATKKRALAIAAARPEVRAVVDRLRVTPAARMTDDEILKRLQRLYLPEAFFQGFAFRAAAPGDTSAEPEFRVLREGSDRASGRIEIEVRDGVVIPNGEVPGLVSRRLAGVMAWWAPGVRDVVDGLEATPPEEDAPIRIEEAVRVVLDREPYVDAGQIRVGVRLNTVRLIGLVQGEAERDMAEADAWCVIGVNDVINEIEVAG